MEFRLASLNARVRSKLFRSVQCSRIDIRCVQDVRFDLSYREKIEGTASPFQRFSMIAQEVSLG